MAAQSNDDPVAIIRESTSVAEIQAGLASLHVREVSLTSKLDALLASQSDLSRSLSGLDNLRAGVGTQAIACRAINNGMLSGAADTASRLSGRVRALDLEKQRVEDTLKVVEQVAELKACVAGVAGSMGTLQDWEAAAGYIARAAKIPEEIIRSEFAAAVVPTVEVPDPPWVTLESARESLCGLFLREFERAVSENDGVRVTRFFKLFPLIGRADVGLDVYGRYVCQGVAAQARAVLREPPNAAGGGQLRKDNFFFANALNKLFEHIAQIVNSHGALVERHYGAGKMVKVIERLQMEADVQGGIILDSWSDERNIDRKLTDTKSYPFSFLVNSFLLQQRGLTGTPRVNSPAMGSGTNTETRNNEDQGVDMKEIDALLSEIAVMLSRWSLYSRFLAAQCRDPDTPSDAPLTIPHVLEKSSLYQKVSARLISPYNTMTTFFFRRSVEKAFQLDETPTGLSLNPSKPIEGNPPFIISAVDDVMYVLSAVIQKSISTCQRDVLGFVIPNIGRVLGSDFIIMIQRKMKDESYPRAAVQGGLPPEDKIISFIVLINSLDVANEYLARIVSNHLGPSSTQARAGLQPNSLKESFPFDHDLVMVTNSLNALNTTFSAKSTELMNDGLQVLFNQLVRYRLRSMLTETFRDVDYTLTEEELAEIARQNDEDEDQLLEQVPRRFQHGWESLMKPLSRIMTPKTFGWLLDMTARHLARVLERRLWGYAGRTTAYGAIRMERDFTGIVSAVAKGNYGLREAFARTTQLLMVANMEEEEWEELNAAPGEDGIEWMLSEEERARARKLVRA
ncbi:hypothetical protein VTK73DRAFT_4523 [Phialemonium thermophilum]|uniref:Conserved oligomeric Golgi complex subunit 4 n=1 Tax=Phialemonium thermophilum TaxID=223376 RepID=A0ABR3WTH1_9PEZI